TALLINSSITMVTAWAALKLNEFEKCKMYMGGTILLGLVFMVIKPFEYTAKFHHGHFPGAHTSYAIYFTLTGLHALHALGGMIVNSFYWGPGSYIWTSDTVRL